MTKSDKDPFWEPPKNYSNLPEFDDLFQELMKHNKRGQCWIKPKSNDQHKLRDFLKNLDDDLEDCYDGVNYEEWYEVYETLKNTITEHDTVKKLLNITEELERWRAKFPSYTQHYWENRYDKNK